ncbi:MAG: hypothetical protein HY243_17860 [Proteobacteria bacterium]|nr:hypothetical protein [Pseudomonadota bacterium]
MKRISLAGFALAGLGLFASSAFAEGNPCASGASLCDSAVNQYLDNSGNAQSVDTNHPLPVNATVTAVSASATTIFNGTVTTGGTFQQIAAANASRKSFEYQNNNGSDACYIYFGTTGSATSAKSIKVVSGGYYLRSAGNIPSDAIQTTCTSTNDTYYAAVQ